MPEPETHAGPRHPRAGWEESMRRMHEAGDDKLLPDFGNKFDDEEWEWPGLEDEAAGSASASEGA